MAAAKAEAAAKAAEEEKMEQEAAWAAGSEPQPATFSHHTDIRSSARRLERPPRYRIPSDRFRGIGKRSSRRGQSFCARSDPCDRRRRSRRTAPAPSWRAGRATRPSRGRRSWSRSAAGHCARRAGACCCQRPRPRTRRCPRGCEAGRRPRRRSSRGRRRCSSASARWCRARARSARCRCPRPRPHS